MWILVYVLKELFKLHLALKINESFREVPVVQWLSS